MNDHGFQLYSYNGGDWHEVDVRGWFRDRVFIQHEDQWPIFELSRGDLKTKGVTEDREGHYYFTKQGRSAEEAAIAKALAEPVKKEVWIWQQWYTLTLNGQTINCWEKVRVINWTERWLFVRNIWGKVSRLKRVLVKENGGAMDQDCHSFYVEWRKDQIEKEKERRNEEARRDREPRYGSWSNFGFDGFGFSSRKADAAILGLTEAATKDEIMAAFKKLAKKHHPDVGGNAEEFKKMSAAKDGLIKALKVSA